MKKKIFNPVFLSAGFLLILIFLSRPILNRAGDFLAPLVKENAEVVILEGTATVKNGAVKEGVDLLKNSQDRRLVIVMHLHEKEGQLFAIQEEYPRLLGEKLKKLGLKEGQLEIILVPINDHPITLTEARLVMARLAKRVSEASFWSPRGFIPAEVGLCTGRQGNDSSSRLIPTLILLIIKKRSGGAKRREFEILFRSHPSSSITWCWGMFLHDMSLAFEKKFHTARETRALSYYA